MQLPDYAPKNVPTLPEQQDALQKGLGRAWQWAATNVLAEEPLLEACLVDKRYDQQCEEIRTDWLWSLIQKSGVQDLFRSRILAALCELADERSAQQLCQFGYRYAQLGDEQFRSRLYEIVETKPFDDKAWLGEQQIVDLDGVKAFLFAVRIRGEQLATRPWDWGDDTLVRTATDALQEDSVVSALQESGDAAIHRFYKTWREQSDSQPATACSAQQKSKDFSAADVLSAIADQKSGFPFRRWGMQSQESELQWIVESLWAATDPKSIVQHLRILSNRPMPTFDTRLIELCQHPDDEVRRWAFTATAQNTDSRVREFAIQELAAKSHEPVVQLLRKNFHVGDEARILDALELPDDPWERHYLLLDILHVLESNPEADCAPLSLIVYKETPCQNCRSDAAALLQIRDAAPLWLIEECPFDAEEPTRKLFMNVTDK